MTWTDTKLKHLARLPITNGLGEAAQEGSPDWPRYIRTTDILTPHSLDPAKRVTLPPDIAKDAVVERGDLLLCAAGSLGKTYLHDSDEAACYAGYLVRFRADLDLADPRFIAYWSQSQPFLDQLAVGAVRSTIDNFSAGKYQNMTLRVPDLDEQRRIADFLDDQVARLDRTVAQRYTQLQTLSEWALAAISELLAPPARSGDGLPNAPWLSRAAETLTKLSSVCLLQSGVTVDASRTGGKEYPYLRVANVQNGSLALDQVKRIVVSVDVARRSLLRAGDVLMTEGGDIDKLGRGSVWHGEIDPCLHQNHVYALRPDTSQLLPEYLAAMTRTHHARCYFESTGSQSTNLASTNSSKVLAFRFPLPSLKVQKEKLHEVEANDKSIDRLSSALRSQIGLLQERKQALITAAVTGQFDVTTARSAA
jgi:type I restriction enzyme S subunit